MRRGALKGKRMSRRPYLNTAFLALAIMGTQAAWAQGSHAGHQSMSAPAAGKETQTMMGMDYDTMPGSRQPAPMKDGPEVKAAAEMDHGTMQMQGGVAPADARDPHEYSGGYELGVGKYALGDRRQLKLADEHSFGSILVDTLERAKSRDGYGTRYDVQAWFGRDYDRFVIKAEGDIANSKLQDARTELLWSHAVASYWDAQFGIRQDSGVGPDRGWLAAGMQGLAPYWFEIDATAYLGRSGRTALRLGAEYELLLTQKLILQPRAEFNLYGKRDAAHERGSGLSDGVFGLRLRYEFSRQFAPYIGVERAAKFGQTADMARSFGEPVRETRWVAGLRFWF